MVEFTRAAARIVERQRALDERGSASLEFVTAGLILLVPLVYLVLALSAVQSGAMAVEGTARHAARIYVEAASDAEGRAAVERAMAVGLADYGIDLERTTVDVTCGDAPYCLEPGSRVSVAIEVGITLPLVPSMLDLRQVATVPISAVATQTVSRFDGVRP